MEKGSYIQGPGSVRIYTAKQYQNTIQGLINGAEYKPGTLYTLRH